MRRLLLFVLLATLAGCAEGADQAQAPETRAVAVKAVKAAAARTADTSLRFTLSLNVEGSADKVELSADGRMDLAAKRMAMTMDMSQVAPEVGSVQMVATEDSYYMRMPSLEKQLLAAGGKPWIKVESQESAFSQPGSTDPTAALTWLQAVGGDLDDLGRDSLRGVEVTHYRAEVPFSALEAEVSRQGGDPKQQAALEALRANGLETLPMEVWVGDDGYVHRFAMLMSLSQDGQRVSIELTMDLFDYGQEVNIDVPATEETISQAEFQRLMAGA